METEHSFTHVWSPYFLPILLMTFLYLSSQHTTGKMDLVIAACIQNHLPQRQSQIVQMVE